MTNPFKKIAPVLGLRGVLFCILGLILLARAIPTIVSMEGVPSISAALIGILLLGVGVRDLIRTAQCMTQLRVDRLEYSQIDKLYGNRSKSGIAIPAELMAADDNPNETNHPERLEWVMRIFPKLAYLPAPYIGALYSALIGLALGVVGLILLVVMRVVFASSTTPAELSVVLDWYLSFYFVAGLVFWAAVSRSGFRRALRFEGNLDAGKLVAIIVILLLGGFFFARVMATGDNTPVPELGSLPMLLVVGALVTIGGTILIAKLRSRRAPDGYQVYRGEEFVTVAMHPTDLVNVVKSYTGSLGTGMTWHLGAWKPTFAEHTAVSAGEFDADLNAESNIQLNETPPARPETMFGTVLMSLGLLLTAVAGFQLYATADIDVSSGAALVAELRTPITLLVFGALFYRVGIIPVSEIEWTSIITKCLVSGTFQTQGGMALMQAGDATVKGSVLTSATVQPRCAYMTSVGFLQPGLAKQEVLRLIDQVTQADQISGELLLAIRNQAQQMTAIGAAAEPAPVALPENPSETRE